MKRREFIRVSAGAAGVLAVGASKSMAQGKPARIFLTRAEDTATALKSAIEATGDLAFLKPGDSVLIKPCVNSGNPWPATSSPELVKLLIRTLKDRGAGEVIVGDRSGMYRNTRECMQRCGLLDAARDAGAKTLFFEDERYVEASVPESKYWGGAKIEIPEIFRDVHRVISLPTVRTHFNAGFTLSIKNWVGVVPMNQRNRMHIPVGFPQRVGELTLLRKADLIFLDGRRGFNSGGPDSGTLIKPGLFAAGVDPVALDVLGLAILSKYGAGSRISGQSPWKNAVISRAAEVSGGVKSGADIKVEAVNVSEIAYLLKFMEARG